MRSPTACASGRSSIAKCLSSAELIYPAGIAADPARQHGLAALAADLLDEGTAELDRRWTCTTRSRASARDLEGDVGADATTISARHAVAFPRRGLELLAAVANRPRFDPDDFRRVLATAAEPARAAARRARAVAERAVRPYRIYGEHPYGHTPLGSEASLGRISLDAVRAFHDQTLLPSGPTLVAVGDLRRTKRPSPSPTRLLARPAPARGGAAPPLAAPPLEPRPAPCHSSIARARPSPSCGSAASPPRARPRTMPRLPC